MLLVTNNTKTESLMNIYRKIRNGFKNIFISFDCGDILVKAESTTLFHTSYKDNGFGQFFYDNYVSTTKTVETKTNIKENGKIQWRCRCDCGNEKDVLSTSLTSGHTQSCGCLQKEKTSAANKRNIDLVGHRFGRLVVLSRSTTSAKCDCGSRISVSTGDLRSGNTQSCGCFKLSHGEMKIKSLLEEYNIPFE